MKNLKQLEKKNMKMFLSFSMIVMIVIVNFYSVLLISNSSGVSLREMLHIAFANAEDPSCYYNEDCPYGMKCENGNCVWKTYVHVVNCKIGDWCAGGYWMECWGTKSECTTDLGLDECYTTPALCHGCDPC